MNEKTVLRLGFLTNLNKTCSIIVQEPASGLTDADVIAAMDEMIASGAVSARSGALEERKSAELETTEITDFVIS